MMPATLHRLCGSAQFAAPPCRTPGECAALKDMSLKENGNGTSGILVVLAIVLVFIIVVAVNSLRVVSPYEKGVIERVGRYQRTAQPGLTIVAPFFDTLRKVDMREQVVDVQPQEVITKDNVVVTVDAIIYYEATDPVKLTYNVADFYSAATKLAQTSLRNVIGETELDEALTSRDMINAKLRGVLDEATDKWGVRIVRVEIKRIDPPVDVTEAMHRQMKAERERRAQILESEGLRQARILQAEGEAEAIRRVADAQQYKLEVEAAGQAHAITTVYNAITAANPDDKLIAIQYLERSGRRPGQATKIFLPFERRPRRAGRHQGIFPTARDRKAHPLADPIGARPGSSSGPFSALPSHITLNPAHAFLRLRGRPAPCVRGDDQRALGLRPHRQRLADGANALQISPRRGPSRLLRLDRVVVDIAHAVQGLPLRRHAQHHVAGRFAWRGDDLDAGRDLPPPLHQHEPAQPGDDAERARLQRLWFSQGCSHLRAFPVGAAQVDRRLRADRRPAPALSRHGQPVVVVPVRVRDHEALDRLGVDARRGHLLRQGRGRRITGDAERRIRFYLGRGRIHHHRGLRRLDVDALHGHMKGCTHLGGVTLCRTPRPRSNFPPDRTECRRR